MAVIRECAYRARVSNKKQLDEALGVSDFEFIYAPMRLLNEKTADKDRIIIVPPVFLGGEEEKVRQKLDLLKGYGFSRVLAHTLGHIELIHSVGMTAHGGFRLNITNGLALSEYEALGLADAVMSIELTLSRMKLIKHTIPTGLIAYGRLPLMLTRRCPISDGKTCRSGEPCGRKIKDRRGNELSVICDECAEILNPDVLIMSDKADELAAFSFIVLSFTDETEILPVLKCCKDKGKPDGSLTRGLYYRGAQ